MREARTDHAGVTAAMRDLRSLLWPIMKRVPAYARLGWALSREPAVPRRYKALLYGAVVYAVTPVHAPLTPIPVLGQIDTPLALLFGLRQALLHCPPAAAERHLTVVKLTSRQLDEDLATLTYVAGRAARSTARSLGFAARVTVGFGRRMGRRLIGGPPLTTPPRD